MFRPALTRRSLLASIAATALVPALGRPVRAETPPAVSYGWNQDVEGPSEATFHVSPQGDDANDGTPERPFRTIQHGVDRLSGGSSGSLALHAGVYREAVSLDALRGTAGEDGAAAYRIHRFGTDPVTISAAEILTGWQPCDPAEAARYGLAAEGLFVARVAADEIRHGEPLALNLHERGLWCPLASLRNETARADATFSTDAMRPAIFATEGGQERIVSLTDPALVGLDPLLLRDSRVLVYHRPNVVSSVAVAAFDPATGTIRFAGDTKMRLQKLGRDPVMLYSILNLPLMIGTGEWFVRREDDRLAVFFRPRNPASLADGVELSARDHCIDFGQATSVELFGLNAIRSAGSRQAASACIRRTSGAGDGSTDIRITQCRAGETITSLGRGAGAIYLRGARGVRLAGCSIDGCRGGFGMFLNDCHDVVLTGFHIRGVSHSAARFFGLRDAVLSFSLFEDCGWDAHANKFNFYQGSDRILVYGIRTRDTGGYVTYQKASRIHFAFCEFDCAPESYNRALVSQNIPPRRGAGQDDGTGDPVPGSTFWYWNLSLVPRPDMPLPADSLSLGPKNSTHRHVIHNCLLNGGGLSSAYVGDTPRDREVRSHNLYTGLSYWQTARYGWALGPGEAMFPPFRKPSADGKDMRQAIEAEIAPLFPAFDGWNLDIDGKTVDWAAPPIGASA